MNRAAVENRAPDLAAEIKRLEQENKTLRRDLRVEQDEHAVTADERDELRNEVRTQEARWNSASRDNEAALKHARGVLEATAATDSFTEIMNTRAIDALTELLGDR